jgi:hypothetical protein
MEKIRLFVVAVAGAALMTVSSHGQGLTMNFVANNGASVQFNGASDSFDFNSGSNGYQWNVSDEVGGSSAVGLNASVLGGPFSYGPITISGSGLYQIQYATVLGPLGDLKMSDGTGGFLTATVNWIDLATYAQAFGDLNASLDVNVTDINYTGTNPDLQFLTANQPGSMDVSFQFTTSETLTQLSTGTGPYTTSFSGSLSVVPEPSTLAVAGLSGLVLLWLRQRKQPKSTGI